MSNAISNISAALGYDGAETLLASGIGTLNAALAFAAAQYANAPLGDDTAPESCRTVYAVAVSSELATVRPGSR